MKNWLKSQANDWLSYLPPVEQRTWLERQVAKHLDIDNEEIMQPFRGLLFIFWIGEMAFDALFRKTPDKEAK